MNIVRKLVRIVAIHVRIGTMRKTEGLWIGAISILMLLYLGCSHSGPSDTNRFGPDDIAVYQEVIRDSFKDASSPRGPFLVSNKTLTSNSSLDNLVSGYGEVSREALEDYRNKSQSAQSLEGAFDGTSNIALIDGSRLSDDNYVSSQSQSHPRSLGVLSFSRVGFNDSKTEAFVEIEYTHCPLCGFGDRVLLKKSERGWKVAQRYGSWVS